MRRSSKAMASSMASPGSVGPFFSVTKPRGGASRAMMAGFARSSSARSVGVIREIGRTRSRSPWRMDLTHIDRVGAYAARHAALQAVQTGAGTCRVPVAYAPNHDMPLDVVYEMDDRAERRPPEWFAHSTVRDRYRGGAFVQGLGARGTSATPRCPGTTQRRCA
jgi:hypothetical protein